MHHPPASGWALSSLRRGGDIAIALAALIAAVAPMLLIAVLIRLTSRGPAFLRQNRIGRQGRVFTIYKFRSMETEVRTQQQSVLGAAEEHRITSVGRLLRRFKLDEFPQFLNVMRGDMALVGPRPKLARYADLYEMPYRPGITGPATLAFRAEERLLRGLEAAELDEFYARAVKPVKARLDLCYMCQATFVSDCGILFETVLNCLRPAPAPGRGCPIARASEAAPIARVLELQEDTIVPE